jgi:uncharacterized protein
MDFLEPKFALLALFLFISNVVEAATGFGATIIALTLAVHFFPIDFLVPVIVPLNLLVSLYIAIRYRDGIKYHTLFTRIVPLAGIGLPLGIALFNLVDAERLKIFFGIFVLCFATLELIRILRADRKEKLNPLTTAATSFWLILGGIVHGLYASGGPMVVYYASRNLDGKHQFRSTLSALWAILSLLLAISHLATGKATAVTYSSAGLLLPVVIAGVIFGELLHSKLPERTFRILVFSILIFSGASIIVKSI